MPMCASELRNLKALLLAVLWHQPRIVIAARLPVVTDTIISTFSQPYAGMSKGQIKKAKAKAKAAREVAEDAGGSLFIAMLFSASIRCKH